MKQRIIEAFWKHGYLLIAALWLYTVSFIISNYWTYYSSVEKSVKKIEEQVQKKEKQFLKYTQDSLLLEDLIKRRSSSIQRNDLFQAPFGFFIYTKGNNQQLIYWNSNLFVFPQEEMSKSPGIYTVKYTNGSFLLRIEDFGNYRIAGMIPVKWNYFIENEYLHSVYDGLEEIDEILELTSNPTSLFIRSITGEPIFYFEEKNHDFYVKYDSFTLLTRSIGIILFLFFLHAFAAELVVLIGFWKPYLGLLFIVVGLRAISYPTHFPFDLSRLQLFDPSIYGSDWIHPSLGDILVNAILLFWLLGFYKTYQVKIPTFSIKKTVFRVALNIALLSVFAKLVIQLIGSLVRDSQISFDVTQFFSLSIYSLIGLIVFCLLIISFFLVAQLLLSPIFTDETSIKTIVYGIIIGLIPMIAYYAINGNILWGLTLLFWLIIFIVILYHRRTDMLRPIYKSTYFIFWVFFFAISISSLLLYQFNQLTQKQLKIFAEKLLDNEDLNDESYIGIATQFLRTDFLFEQFERLKLPYSNQFIKDSLVRENFTGYLNRYETSFYFFDINNEPLFNPDARTTQELDSILTNQSEATQYDGLFRSKNNIGEFSSFYFKMDISSEENRIGKMYVKMSPREFKDEAFYPEIFRQSSLQNKDGGQKFFAFAIYDDGNLIRKANQYQFSLKAPPRVGNESFSVIQNKQYNELWYYNDNNYQSVVVTRNQSFISFLTLFAYLFFAFLSVFILFQLIHYLLTQHITWPIYKNIRQWNIRTQVYALIIFISFFSFVAIATSTIFFFINRFEQNNEDRISKITQLIVGELETKSEIIQQGIVIESSRFDEMRESKELLEELIRLSRLNGIDINIYNPQGYLYLSTQPYIFNKRLLSSQIDPIAFFHVRDLRESQFIHKEKVGTFEFLSTYAPIIYNGNCIAYVNIPYLNSQLELKQEISGFLATLININFIVFLLAVAIAFAIANRITDSFTLIGDKMRQVHLGRHNELIIWNRQDEIGLLVKEYNKMMVALEESAAALAKSEREGAWREMARQVAHEIKNPLTPMKLSLQYLQIALKSNAPNLPELIERTTRTLVEQIDQLARIAGDFSQFANIGSIHWEVIDLYEILTSQKMLLGTERDVQIDLKEIGEPALIKFDKIQLARLFTNLIQNAIEASEQNEIKKVNIELKDLVDRWQISITDNGTGIPKEKIPRIFTPNFTTKSSGTGLGLAISKGIVEKAGGQIYFTTTEHVGSTFFIEFPKYTSQA
ncbi:MAG: ATP-binding protein [Chitinophagaceae bacterium]|nr:ATP-binding protein [Chitinophagaceae bacterium]